MQITNIVNGNYPKQKGKYHKSEIEITPQNKYSKYKEKRNGNGIQNRT